MKRRWGMAVWLLVAGAVASVLIAWGAAATARVSGRETKVLSSFDGSANWTVRVLDMPAGTRVDSFRQRGSNWSPEQATGAPDSNVGSDDPKAWASLGQDDRDEWLDLKYAKPIAPVAIHVHENFCPGAVSKATMFDREGKEVTVWEQANPTTQPGGVAILKVAKSIASDRVKLYIDSKRVPGWNEIDAVGLKDAQGQMYWAKMASASTTYAAAGLKGAQSPSMVLPAWATSLKEPTPAFGAHDVNVERRAVDARGWPFPALAGEVVPGGVAMTLPMRPIWTGLAADTLILALGVAALWFVTVVLRRFVVQSLRLRRGRCMQCGYDLRFDLLHGCPECGWRRDAANA
jgi:hypothetical protein